VEFEQLVEHGFCKTCRPAFIRRRRQQLLDEDMWSALPLIFGLNDWIELDKLKENALEW
jgi:hypothetical protein